MAAAAAAGEVLDETGDELGAEGAIGRRDARRWPCSRRRGPGSDGKRTSSRGGIDRGPRRRGVIRRRSRTSHWQRPVRPRSRPQRARREPWAGAATAQPAWTADWPADARWIRRSTLFPGRISSPRELIGGATDDPVRRLGVALVAWPPIGLAAAAAISDVTGCAVYRPTAAVRSRSFRGSPRRRSWDCSSSRRSPGCSPAARSACSWPSCRSPHCWSRSADRGCAAGRLRTLFLLGLAWLAGIAWAIAQTRRGSVAGAGP